MYHDNRDYTAMRLNGTVVREIKNKRLVLIREIGYDVKGLVASVQTLIRGARQYIVHLDELNLASPKLGNITFEGRVYYVSRMPKRNDWRQGLRQENLVFVDRGRMHNYHLPSLKYLAAPIFRDYLRYEKCIERGGAFSRTFSLDPDLKLWYKCQKVVGQDVNGVPVLDEKFMWLKEALEDAVE